MKQLPTIIDRIAFMPEGLMKIGVRTRRCILKGVPYALLYVIEPDEILITAVAHLHRDPHMKSEVKTKICITVKSIFFDFTGRPLVTADYLTHTYIGYKESRFLSRVTGST